MWHLMYKASFRFCVPMPPWETPVLYKIYPSYQRLGPMVETSGPLACLTVQPQDDIEAYAAYLEGVGGWVGLTTLHYVTGVLPASLDTKLVVLKDEADSVVGELYDFTGRKIQDITFTDYGSYAVGDVTLPYRGLFYAYVKIGDDSLNVVEMFFRRRIAMTPIPFVIIPVPRRRVVILR